jgi:hypothetical protein
MSRSITFRHLLAAAIAAAAVLGTAATSATAAPACATTTWGSLPKAAGASGQAALTDVRTGQHDCYDRVVFDFDGPATGYQVDYAGQVLSEARGEPLAVAGGAVLHVGLSEPAVYAAAPGAHVAGVSGYRTLRDVVSGGTFEGHTTFAVGVRARLPFRVFTLAGPDSGSRIVLDVAHVWPS